MRYYVYVSETKVDQLYAQIPTKLRDKIAAKLTIDLRLIKVEVGGRQPQESLFSKLEMVRVYLEERDLIGSVDNPGFFFAQTMPLSWGFYGVESSGESSEFVYFGGRTEKTVLGMGGSLQHVIGEAGRSYTHSASNTVFLFHALKGALSESVTEPDIDADERLLKYAGQILRRGASIEPRFILDAVAAASGRMRNPWEPMEFVAKRLINGAVPRREWSDYTHEWKDLGPIKVLLGTPLYVALAE